MPKAVAFENIEVAAGGGADVALSTSMTEKIVLSTSGAIVMAGNYTLTHDGAWAEGSELDVLWTGSATLGAFNIILFGYALTQAQATAGNLEGTAYAKSGTVVFTPKITAGSAQIGTADIAALAVTTAKIDNLAVTSGKLGASSVIAGKINAGAIVNADINAAAGIVYTKLSLANSIVNADIKTTAAIEVSKLEAMSDGEIITGNTGSGNIATIVPSSGDVLTTNTGAQTIQTASVTPAKATTNLTDDEISVDVSFVTGSVGGNFTTLAPCNGTILSIAGTVTFLIEATNNATVTPNIGGVAVTGGLVTFTAGDVLNTDRAGTAVTATNTFTAGQEINLVTAKITSGGTARITIKYRRTS